MEVKISPFVFIAVLTAAAFHAGWNAMLKIRLEPFLTMVLINAAGGLIGIPFLILWGWPAPESHPSLLASTLLHLAYYFTLTSAYKRADMGQVYPIARGAAPLMTSMFAFLWLDEPLSQANLIGISLLGLGIFTMAFHFNHSAHKMDRPALLFALMTAVSICGYTVADGTGARLSGNPHSYTAALFVVDGFCFTLVALLLRGITGLKPIMTYALPGLFGGAMSCAAYGIAIWAMTVAPIPLVAAIRETSVLFGAVIAVVFLKEPLRTNRILAAVLIVCGLTIIRL